MGDYLSEPLPLIGGLSGDLIALEGGFLSLRNDSGFYSSDISI